MSLMAVAFRVFKSFGKDTIAWAIKIMVEADRKVASMHIYFPFL